MASEVERLILQSVADDWISDYEMQGDYEQDADLEPGAAFRAMVERAFDWIGRGVLVPGQMLENGFVSWPGSAAEKAQRFAAEATRYSELSKPGQICWFDGVGDLPAL